MKPIRVLLADDHTLVRAGLRALLGNLPAMEVVGEASSGEEALILVESLRPDILLCDISMPGLSGLEVADRVARDFPGTRTVILRSRTIHCGLRIADYGLRIIARSGTPIAGESAICVLPSDSPANSEDAAQTAIPPAKPDPPALERERTAEGFSRSVTRGYSLETRPRIRSTLW
jgi:CheY-like chemotaxis protein